MPAAMSCGFQVFANSTKHFPQPKKLIVLKGSAHAQYLFQTDQGDRVMREIVRFLGAN